MNACKCDSLGRCLHVCLYDKLKKKKTIADICFLLGSYVGCRKISRQVRVSASQLKVIHRRLKGHLITPRLDNCNSVFAGLPQSTLEPLQRVQNAAARLVFDLRHRDHVSAIPDATTLAARQVTSAV